MSGWLLGARMLTMLSLAAGEYERDDDFQFVRKSKKARTEEPEPVKRPARGRPAKDAAPQNDDAFFTRASTAAGTKTSRRKGSPEVSVEESRLKVPKRGSRRSAKDTSEPQPNGAATRPAGKKSKSSRAEPGPAVESAKIALPMSDTPIINRNKEMRKKGNGTRRSSLGSRGRRASSLIESGQTAIPHREVSPSEFYKHIESEGLPEPRRMKQLLTWCGERSLAEKPPLGTPNANAILGGKGS